MNNLVIEQVRAQIVAELGQEPVRCRGCAAWVSRRGIASHIAVVACEAAACQREAADYDAALAKRRAA